MVVLINVHISISVKSCGWFLLQLLFNLAWNDDNKCFLLSMNCMTLFLVVVRNKALFVYDLSLAVVALAEAFLHNIPGQLRTERYTSLAATPGPRAEDPEPCLGWLRAFDYAPLEARDFQRRAMS